MRTRPCMELMQGPGCNGFRPNAAPKPTGAQYPLIKEDTLNHNMKSLQQFKVYSLIKGYWALWDRTILGT